MEIKPIKNEHDYGATMSSIDDLMDAKPNTPAGDQLDVLVTLAEAWEQRRHPIESLDPVLPAIDRQKNRA